MMLRLSLQRLQFPIARVASFRGPIAYPVVHQRLRLPALRAGVVRGSHVAHSRSVLFGDFEDIRDKARG